MKRRTFITGAIGAIAAISGCIGGDTPIDAQDVDGQTVAADEPLPYPDGAAALGDRGVLINYGAHVLQPRSVTLTDRVPVDRLETTPGGWNTDEIEAVSPPAGNLAIIRMRYVNRASDVAGGVPPVDTVFGVRSAFGGGVTQTTESTVGVAPVDAPGETVDTAPGALVAGPAEYPLHESARHREVPVETTVEAFYVCTVPTDLSVDDVHPAMGVGDGRDELPVRWENGYTRSDMRSEDTNA